MQQQLQQLNQQNKNLNNLFFKVVKAVILQQGVYHHLNKYIITTHNILKQTVKTPEQHKQALTNLHNIKHDILIKEDVQTAHQTHKEILSTITTIK